jgi:hypothetical protein
MLENNCLTYPNPNPESNEILVLKGNFSIYLVKKVLLLEFEEINYEIEENFKLNEHEDIIRYLIMSKLLRLVLALFPDHEELGLMDITGTHKLSPFNIRLNSLVSYATGDRATSLDAMIENMGSRGKITRTPPYTIPKWLDDMTQECTPATRDNLNRQSQLFLGIDACDSDGKHIDYYEKCKGTITEDKKYCYITRNVDGYTLDPRTFVKRRKNIGGRSNKKHSKKVRSKRRKYTTKKRKVRGT